MTTRKGEGGGVGEKGFSRRMGRRPGDREGKDSSPLYTYTKLSKNKSMNKSKYTHCRGRRKGFNNCFVVCDARFYLGWITENVKEKGKCGSHVKAD